MTQKAPPASRILRSALLAGVGASIIAKELGGLARQQFSKKIDELKEHTRTEQVRLLTEALSHLKGSAMKFGQMLSLEAQDYLPPEAQEILARLQKNAESVDNSTLFALIKEELGEEKFQAMHLHEEAIATASVGQVYRGTVGLQAVAVKVQFPQMRESIGSDLAMVRNVAPLLLSVFGKKMDLDDLLVEVETVLLLETDYGRELNNLIEYGDMLKSDQRYVVPKPLAEYSSSRVLTMSFEEGLHLRDWIQSKPSLQMRQKVGEAILDLYIAEFFQFGLVQTDPNLANFLVREDGQLVLLDCGALLRYDSQFVQMYKKLLQVMLKGNDAEIVQYCETKKLLDPREKPDVKEMFAAVVKAAVSPFDPKNQPFNFSDKDYSTMIRKLVVDFSRKAEFTKPPREFIFLHRKLGGVFNILKMLQLEIDLSHFWAKVTNE